MREIALWPSTILNFLVLPGSELSITEITEYKYFSPSKPLVVNEDVKVSKILWDWFLLLNQFCFCET